MSLTYLLETQILFFFFYYNAPFFSAGTVRRDKILVNIKKVRIREHV